MKKRKKDTISQPHVLIGFDSEYVARERITTDANGYETTETYNHVLSYQIYGLNGEREWEDMMLIDNQRWTFQQLIRHAIGGGIRGGALDMCPGTIYICAHFSRADITTLLDFRVIARQLDCCRNTLTTLMKPVTVSYSGDPDQDDEIAVYLRDSWLLTPDEAGKLEAIGELVGIPKINIAPYKIEQMDKLLEKDPALFRRYAMTDPKISVHYIKRVTALGKKLWKQDTPPVTIGGCATKFALHAWEAAGVDHHAVLGTQEIKVKDYKRTRKITVPKDERSLYEPHAASAFSGGRGEAFYYGAAPPSHYFDYDLRGAYSMALASIGMPLWHRLRATTDIDAFQLDVIGFAKLRFRFPDGTRFPCLPVREDGALIFPLRGETNATAAEVFLARRMGAELEINHGCVMPMDFSVRPFLSLSKRINELRRHYREQYGSKSLFESFIKTVGNSLYGKLAQAVRSRRVYDTRTMQMKDLEPSPITNPFLAATVPGLIRAVLGEILSRVPRANRVLSVTTDGFLCDVPKDMMETLCDGPICQLFSAIKQLVDGDPKILEVKHEVEELIVWRTRGAATILPEGGIPGKVPFVILARAGFKRNREIDEVQESGVFVDRFLDRKAGEVTSWKRLRGVRDILEKGGDMVSVDQRVRYTMDPDWKRLPWDACERPLKKRSHLCFDTKPIRCVEDYRHIRASWKDYYQRYGRALKCRDDLLDFQEFSGVIESGRLQLPRDTHVVFVAKSMFAIAYFRGVWGLQPMLTNKQLANLLSGGGYQTEVWEVENAKRPKATLREHCVRETPALRRFLDFIRAHFPSLQEERLVQGTVADLW